MKKIQIANLDVQISSFVSLKVIQKPYIKTSSSTPNADKQKKQNNDKNCVDPRCNEDAKCKTCLNTGK